MSQYTYCIVTGGLVWMVLYRNAIDCIVTEADFAATRRKLGAQVGWYGRAGAGRWAGTGLSACGTQEERGARCCAVGCALGALSLFLTRFDSILFLSQFLDIVHEPGS